MKVSLAYMNSIKSLIQSGNENHIILDFRFRVFILTGIKARTQDPKSWISGFESPLSKIYAEGVAQKLDFFCVKLCF